MFNIVRKEINWAGKKLVLETGKIARQADGAVIATYGDTMVLATVVSDKRAKEGIDFFPLTVNYVEKTYAAGRIPGGFFKREGRLSEKETLVSRLIDRPIRPLFPDGFYNETQVICTVLSHDMENDPDIVALVAASAALAISGVPFLEPVGGARVGLVNGQLVLNPTLLQMEESVLDLVVAGTESSVLMVESEAKELSEAQMLEAVMFGHNGFQPVIQAIKELKIEAGKAAWALLENDKAELYEKIRIVAEADLRIAYAEVQKQLRKERVDSVRDIVMAEFGADHDELKIGSCFKELEKNVVRGNIIDTGMRIDGRDHKTIRQIISEVDLLPKAHGSALFTRGETQALVAATLGTSQDEQIIDALEGESREHFMLHYNFPPFSVGEAAPLRAPGRREIGHGKLAWRAIKPMLPKKEDFPYTLRVVSEITESNGSSSMATVCGTSLALMGAGVPMKMPVAGIAMGLIKEDKHFVVLSDILGDEDHLGDMDFKVAGTSNGVTALQMDIKINGINEQIMKEALEQARHGIDHILGEMSKALTTPRGEVSMNAPKITTLKINKDKIREVIGSGGKVIRDICEKSGAKVDIDDDGTIRVAAIDGISAEKAIGMIMDIAAEPEIGAIYHGAVVKLVQFGAFVRYLGSREGLVHVSEITGERVENVEEYLKEGDEVYVRLVEVDSKGKVRLSMVNIDQNSGESTGEYVAKKRKTA